MKFTAAPTPNPFSNGHLDDVQIGAPGLILPGFSDLIVRDAGHNPRPEWKLVQDNSAAEAIFLAPLEHRGNNRFWRLARR